MENYTEKIATLFPKDNSTSGAPVIVYNYNFENLPTVYSPSFVLGVFGLKTNKEYLFHIQVFDYSNTKISDSFTQNIRTDSNNFDKSKHLTPELVASTFELKTTSFTVVDNGMYRLRVSLIHENQDLDSIDTYFHTSIIK